MRFFIDKAILYNQFETIEPSIAILFINQVNFALGLIGMALLQTLRLISNDHIYSIQIRP